MCRDRTVVDDPATAGVLLLHQSNRGTGAQEGPGQVDIDDLAPLVDRELVERHRPRSVAYTATKHAITGLTKSTALDGRPYDIACGQIDIGNAATELAGRFATGTAQADGSVRAEPLMDVAAVARAVCYMASLPLDANVATMTVMATKMPYVGRG